MLVIKIRDKLSITTNSLFELFAESQGAASGKAVIFRLWYPHRTLPHFKQNRFQYNFFQNEILSSPFLIQGIHVAKEI